MPTVAKSVILTVEECKELYRLIASLAGGNPEDVFAWDGTDDIRDPHISACVKVYTTAGASVPDHCKEQVSDTVPEADRLRYLLKRIREVFEESAVPIPAGILLPVLRLCKEGLGE